MRKIRPATPTNPAPSIFRLKVCPVKPFNGYHTHIPSADRLVRTINPDLSIVIPAYDEEERIARALNETLECIAENHWKAEILVVDDGSTDATVSVVKSIAAQHPEIRLLLNGTNRGKGYSVRNGMLNAQGNIILFTDSDLSAPIREASLLLDAIRSGADIAIGSRWLNSSRQTVRQPLYRRFLGRCFNLATRVVADLPFADTQCGFKAFTRATAQTVFQLQRIERWGFDPEVLFIALHHGFTIREIPITWGHDERTRISYFRAGLQMLKELCVIRWNALSGAYSKPVRMTAPATR